MRIQQGSGAGSAEKGEACVADCAVPGDNPHASPIEMIGMPEPPPPPKRWLPQRKAEVMDAVRGGFLSLDDALDRYALSIDEYLAWQRRIGLFGLAGLRVNGTQPRRRVRTRPAKH